ncbi:hypothetical protein BC832DRAFT_545359 [Gaertneriomyces semiglobifer]|nr:hypothetical protein BC832DRAFT_545359 [Gaertneriomyces semiglobifer]
MSPKPFNSTGRGIASLFLAMGWFPNTIVAQFACDYSYMWGRIALSVYLASIIQMTPSYALGPTLPSTYRVFVIELLYIVLEHATILPLALLSGHARDSGDLVRESLIILVHYTLISAYMFIFGVVFAFFGYMIIRAAEAARKDLRRALRSTSANQCAGKNEFVTATVLTSSLDASMRKAIRKLMVMHVMFGIGIIWYASMLVVFANRHDETFARLWWSKLACVATNFFSFFISLYAVHNVAHMAQKPVVTETDDSFPASISNTTV